MTQVIKNAVRETAHLVASRPASAFQSTYQVPKPGKQTASIPVSIRAAARGKTENSTARPQAICPNPVRYASPVRKGIHDGTRVAVIAT